MSDERSRAQQMGWTVGAYRIEYEPPKATETGAGALVVDGEDRFAITKGLELELGRARVRVRLALDKGVVRPALWLGDVRVPSTPATVARSRAPEGSLCVTHEGGRGPYRGAEAAKIACPVCRALVCLACAGPDKVLCAACFERAHAEERALRDQYTRSRSVTLSVFMLLLALVGMYAARSRWILFGASLGLAALAAANIRHQVYKGRRARALWPGKQGVPALPKHASTGPSVTDCLGPAMDVEPARSLART